MRDVKLPLKEKFIKGSCFIVHQLVTCVLLSRRENRNETLKEDIVVTWLLTHNYQVH